MGIGAVLFVTLLFAPAACFVATRFLRLAWRVKRRWLQLILIGASLTVSIIGILPFAGNLYVALWPRSAADPSKVFLPPTARSRSWTAQGFNGRRTGVALLLQSFGAQR